MTSIKSTISLVSVYIAGIPLVSLGVAVTIRELGVYNNNSFVRDFVPMQGLSLRESIVFVMISSAVWGLILFRTNALKSKLKHRPSIISVVLIVVAMVVSIVCATAIIYGYAMYIITGAFHPAD